MGLDIYTGGEGKSIQHVIFFPHNKTHALHNKDNRKHKYAPHKRNKKHKLKQRYKTELQLVVYKQLISHIQDYLPYPADNPKKLSGEQRPVLPTTRLGPRENKGASS